MPEAPQLPEPMLPQSRDGEARIWREFGQNRDFETTIPKTTLPWGGSSRSWVQAVANGAPVAINLHLPAHLSALAPEIAAAESEAAKGDAAWAFVPDARQGFPAAVLRDRVIVAAEALQQPAEGEAPCFGFREIFEFRPAGGMDHQAFGQ